MGGERVLDCFSMREMTLDEANKELSKLNMSIRALTHCGSIYDYVVCIDDAQACHTNGWDMNDISPESLNIKII